MLVFMLSPIVIMVALFFFAQKAPSQLIYALIPRRPRFLNALVASLGAYFWLPCPLCGKKFAGYEWLPGNDISTWSGGEGVCYRCREKAKKLNQEYFKNNPPPIKYC